MERGTESKKPEAGGRARRRPAPQKNGTNGSTNGSHKGDPEPLLGRNHPLASVAGSFKDDPFWDEFIQIMKDERRKEDERDFETA